MTTLMRVCNRFKNVLLLPNYTWALSKSTFATLHDITQILLAIKLGVNLFQYRPITITCRQSWPRRNSSGKFLRWILRR